MPVAPGTLGFCSGSSFLLAFDGSAALGFWVSVGAGLLCWCLQFNPIRKNKSVKKDPSSAVIDEVLGVGVAMFNIPTSMALCGDGGYSFSYF